MDGDLQHPPRVVPQLMDKTMNDTVNLVVASRYTDEGDSTGLSSRWRVVVSLAFTWMARIVFPFRLGSISDPMSGFFAVRLSALDLDVLRPAGYKVLLEIVARSHLGRAAQVPFSFQARHAGESKATATEAYLCVRQLVRLRLASWASPAKRMASFLLVGASGVIVNTLLLALLLQTSRMSYVLASFVATQVAVLWNYVLLRSWVFHVADGRAFLAGLVRFWTLNMVLLPVHLGLLAMLVEMANASPVTANVIALAIIFVLRYAVSSVWVFRIRHGRGPADIDEELADIEAWIVDGDDDQARARQPRRTGHVDQGK
jgi:putative flippase GtrA